MIDHEREKRAETTERLLSDAAVHATAPVEQLACYETQAFAEPSELPTAEFEPCEPGRVWHRDREADLDNREDLDVTSLSPAVLPEELSLGTNVWFRLSFSVPEEMAGHPVYLQFVVEPLDSYEYEPPRDAPRVECLCFRDGEPWQAFDSGHDNLLLTDDADGGETFELLIEVGTTVLAGGLSVETFRFETASLVSTRPEVRKLHRTVTVLNEYVETLDAGSPNYGRLLRAISEARSTVPFDGGDEAALRDGAREALESLEAVASDLTSDMTDFTLSTSGHAHVDMAWLWPWSETVRKGGRTFSNALTLMEEFPEFRFTQSQPHLYEFVADRYPSVFERVEERIEEGRWMPTGALWVESDINNVGGEALARQFLYGKRYFRERFDVDPNVVFLPDVFGYSAGLPGIAAAADCEYFLTQKMSWNEIDEFPHSTFWWEGIDGSRLLTHFPPVSTYNGLMTVEEVTDSVREHEQNDVLDSSAYLVGYGDGGGGTTREILERARVIDDVGALPDVEFEPVSSFFERVEQAGKDLPTWEGELYLEKHRGTLTSQARTKRNNRKGEFALREAELWSALAHASEAEYTYPLETLTEAWKLLLFNQFHDILPGSSVSEVYADAERDYAALFDRAGDVREAALSALVGRDDDPEYLCVTNSLSWPRSPLVSVDVDALPEGALDGGMATEDGDALAIQPTGDGRALFEVPDVPALGATSVTAGSDDPDVEGGVSVSESRLENESLRVEFDGDGFVDSLYDKDDDREVLDGPANRLVCYDDYPANWDAWDIDQDVTTDGEALPSPDSVEVLEDGPLRGTIRQVRTFGDSKLVQDIRLRRGSQRLDFETRVEWHEEHRLLKTHVPVDVDATSAAYEVQFGHDERPTHDNTSWDEARFEEAHQKWVDVSAYDYGVAVLNDCKYGVHVDETDVGLSLLRAPVSPDPEADRGTHEFTYSIRPHEGSVQESGVVEDAYALNAPVQTVPADSPVEFASVSVDDPGVVVESIKRAEDRSDRLVVRLYEARGRETSTRLRTDFDVEAAVELNLIEDAGDELAVDGDDVALSFSAHEIRTIGIDLEEPA